MKRRKILYHVTPDTDASPIYHEMVSQLALGMQAQADVDLSAALDDHPRLRWPITTWFMCSDVGTR